MALMNWDDKFVLGINSIDAQHKVLVGMINDLHDAMREGKAKSILGEIIEGLSNYTKTHFLNEETLFDTYNYPETIAHRKEHSAFISQISDFQQGFSEGKLSVSIQVMNFLKDWLKSHIMDTDKQYVPFLISKGVK
jgi:hemerythrin-like metal-binding protein